MMDTYVSRHGIPTDSASIANQLTVEEQVKAFLPEELRSEQEFGGFRQQFGDGDPNNST